MSKQTSKKSEMGHSTFIKLHGNECNINQLPGERSSWASLYGVTVVLIHLDFFSCFFFLFFQVLRHQLGPFLRSRRRFRVMSIKREDPSLMYLAV